VFPVSGALGGWGRGGGWRLARVQSGQFQKWGLDLQGLQSAQFRVPFVMLQVYKRFGCISSACVNTHAKLWE